MTDRKNILDDYYSNINSGVSPDDIYWAKKILKIKPKRKIIKKQVILKKKKSESSSKSFEEKPRKMKIVSSDKEKKFEKVFASKKIKLSEFKNEKKVVLDTPNTSDIPNTKDKTKLNTKTNDSYSAIKPRKKSFSWKKKWLDDFENKPRKKSLFPYSTKTSRRKIYFFDEEKDSWFIRSNKINKKKKEEKKVEDIEQNLVDRTWQIVVVPDLLNLKIFSEKIWVTLPKLIAEFMKNGIMVNINSKIDFDSASIIADAFQIKLERDSSSWMSVKDVLEGNLSYLLSEDDSSKLKSRPPVISIMWHVDHWKTSLLDYIRKSKIADKEAGWITQSIWAYQVEQNGQKMTFLDTPGHEAFALMRARWAKSTDIAILVVAADEWVKPQTIESISHAKEAGIPIIVAINKMDKEVAKPDHVKWQLTEHGLTPEDWGWDIPMIPVSAKSWFGIDELLEIILLVAEVQDLKANPDRMWIVTVIESHLDTKLWPVATILVNAWTVKSSDNIVCKDTYWKVKIMKDHTWKNIKKAIVWEPVLIAGLSKVLEWWDIIQVVSSLEKAHLKSIEYTQIAAKQKHKYASWLDLLMSRIKSWNLKHLKIVLKADSNWSLEAIKWSLLKLWTLETSISIIHSWVWNITEWDVLMCEWSDAILIWFWVIILSTAKNYLETSNIEYINSDIIYHITERVGKIVTWMLDPKEIEVILWKAKVGGIFYTDKDFMILWLVIWKDSEVESWAEVRVIRSKKLVWKWKIDSLKKWVEEVNSVEWPTECWIKFVGNIKIEEKDELEIYKIEIEK